MDLQSTQGRRVPQRQDARRRRRHHLHRSSSRRGLEIAGEELCRTDRGDAKGRRPSRHLHPEGGQRRLPVHFEFRGVRDPPRQGRRCGVRHRYGRVLGGALRSRRKLRFQAQSQLLQGRPGVLRYRPRARGLGSDIPAERPGDRRGRHHQPGARQDRGPVREERGCRSLRRHRVFCTTPSRCGRTWPRSTTTTCASP